MNYDHLLTRVFDKQEKKMFYMGCRIGTLKLGEDMRSFEAPEFSGINNFGFLIEHIRSECLMRSFIPFGDRFIPMTCSGQKDQNKKLIYGSDIVKICDGVDCSYHEIVWGYDYPAFDISPLLQDECNNLQEALTELFVEVVGNKFLNPDLLPKEQVLNPNERT